MKRLIQFFAVLIALAIGLAKAPFSGRARTPPTRGESPTAEHAGSSGWSKWKRRLVTIAVFLVMLAVGGFLLAASGIMPIKASSGHWAITAWFLNFSMSRSVSTHSLGIKTPDFTEPYLVLKGARHYDTGCRPCHGSPDLHNPRIAQAMTPHPPYLPPMIENWEPEELFYIVKHGVKFTGMPAWPTQQRDDEVWAMVAFLLELPELDEAGYERLARGSPGTADSAVALEELSDVEDVPQAVVESCSRCHGVRGLGQGLGAFPRLAGQSPEYLAATLNAFAEGVRHSGIMEPIAAGLDRDEVREVARYFSTLDMPASEPTEAEADEAIERGAAIARSGIPAQKVPACVHCHGPGDGERNPNYPALAGQYAEYLALQLELFKDRNRDGTEYAHLMHPVADGLSAGQRRDVAVYYESLSR